MCSKYYDPEKPYSIDNWNLLIRDVNDILTNPDEGCEPLDPLEEVEDPHLWAVKDINEVRDALKETCPDISFGEELVLWNEEIIDEIENQMEEAWCDCGEPDEDDRVLCAFGWTPMNAGFSSATANTVEMTSPCYICAGMCQMISYGGSYYTLPGPEIALLLTTIHDTSGDAYIATKNFIRAMNKLPTIATRMESYQNSIDQATAQMDSLIEQYDAECEGVSPEPPQCGQIAANICALGKQARTYQDLVDDEVENFQEKYGQGMTHMAGADALAQQNSIAVMSLHGRFPTDHNIFAECYSAELTDLAWYDWWDPERGELGRIINYMSNQASAAPGVFVTTQGYRINSNGPSRLNTANIRLSPNGYWYINRNTAAAYNRDYSMPYQDETHTWKCETLFPLSQCLEEGQCGWGSPDSLVRWWSQGWQGGWIWNMPTEGPPPEIYDWRGEDEFHLYIKKRPGLENNSEKRDEWLDLHNNWYDTHEQYDDRHEVYC